MINQHEREHMHWMMNGGPLFIVMWCAYGKWNATHPFYTEKAAADHIERVLCTPERDYNKFAQIIPVEPKQ